MSLYDWLLIWLEKYEKNTIKRTTYENYEAYIQNYYIVFNKPMKKLSLSELQDFFNEKVKLGLSAKTIRNMAMILRKALKQAVIEKIIDDNIALYVNLPKVQKKEIIILTNEQREKLIEESYFHRYGIFIRLTLCTGLRLGELLGLKWEDIDFTKKELHVRRTLHRSKNYNDNVKNSTSIFFDEPKTEKSRRTIPLHINAIEDLQDWHKKQIIECPFVQFVVTDQHGKFMESTTFKKYYNRMLDKCNISGITFHALRHTFATTALEKGMDVKVISEILGHYSVAFTLDTYAHVLNTFKRKNMELMNDVYKKACDNKKITILFKPFKNQYIVSIPNHNSYTFIADSIQEGINYILEKQNNITLDHNIDTQNVITSKADNEIVIVLN